MKYIVNTIDGGSMFLLNIKKIEMSVEHDDSGRVIKRLSFTESTPDGDTTYQYNAEDVHEFYKMT